MTKTRLTLEFEHDPDHGCRSCPLFRSLETDYPDFECIAVRREIPYVPGDYLKTVPDWCPFKRKDNG